MSHRLSLLARYALCAQLLLPLGWPSQASAQEDDATARAAFEAGRTAYDEAEYELALSEFKRSYEISRRPALLYNIGMTLDRLRLDREAIAALEQYIAEQPDAANRPVVARRLLALKKRVAALDTEATAQDKPAPTPEQTARAEIERSEAAPVPVGRTAAPSRRAPERDESTPVYGTWWFWTLVGAVVATGVVTGVVIAQPDGAPSSAIRL